MRRVLILNSGSSTFKWSLLDADDESTIDGGSQTWTDDDRSKQIGAVLARTSDLAAVGHRIVHGGTLFREAQRLNPRVQADLESLVDLDALHMRSALSGVDAVSALLPEVPQVVAFDSAFHTTLSDAAAVYALPFELSERWGLRRFGFHGLSVAHAVQQTQEMLGTLPALLVVCHLGSGCSMTAVKDGRSFDTTMGFTPLEGLMMATRAGSVDPGLLLHLQLRCGMSAADLLDTLSNRSGLLGVSGVSADLREVLAAAEQGNPRARLAYEHFILAAKHGLGAMIAALGGLDAIVFTGGIGENSPRVRSDVVSAISFTAAYIDESANGCVVPDGNIARHDSRIPVLVIRAREDLVVLREVCRLIDGAG